MQHVPEEDNLALSQMACGQIKRYIIEHSLQPGEKLPTERKLAELLGVSRPVIREALSHLETLGLLEKHQGRGIFIKEQNLSRLFQEMMFLANDDPRQQNGLSEFRYILEQAAILQAIGKCEEEDYSPLRETIQQAQQAATNEEFRQLDAAFHRQLVQLARNPFLTQLTEVIAHYFATLKEDELNLKLSPNNRAQTLAEHSKLLDLMQAGDRIQSLALIEIHLHHAPRTDDLPY